jgi:hypothetical protein
MRREIRERLASINICKSKQSVIALLPYRFSRPKTPLPTLVNIAGTMTIARIAEMLQIPVWMAQKEQIRFLRYVEDNVEFSRNWEHEIDAWLDYQIRERQMMTSTHSLPFKRGTRRLLA